MGIVAALAGALLLTLIEREEPLSLEHLRQARLLWEETRPPDYTLELEVRGVVQDDRRIQVRSGEVVGMTVNGVEASVSAWDYWTVEGLFEFLSTELGNAVAQGRTYGVTSAREVSLRARFDPRWGYPAYFSRRVQGGLVDTEWAVVGFEVGR